MYFNVLKRIFVSFVSVWVTFVIAIECQWKNNLWWLKEIPWLDVDLSVKYLIHLEKTEENKLFYGIYLSNLFVMWEMKYYICANICAMQVRFY